jgi:hypothetical protein
MKLLRQSSAVQLSTILRNCIEQFKSEHLCLFLNEVNFYATNFLCILFNHEDSNTKSDRKYANFYSESNTVRLLGVTEEQK